MKKKNLNLISWLPYLVLAFAVFLGVSYAKRFPKLNTFLHEKFEFRDAPAWGQLGDFFGGLLNPLISLFTLFVAVRVWELQKTQLSETKAALEKQTQHLDTAIHREQQSTNEKLFFSVLEKIKDAAMTINGNPRNESLDSLVNHIVVRNPHTINNRSIEFKAAYTEGNKTDLNDIIDTKLPDVSIYLELTELALQIIEKRIDDKAIFVQLFCAQVGQRQLSLIALMTCSSKLRELHRLVLLFKLHEKLPTSEFATHLNSDWHSQID